MEILSSTRNVVSIIVSGSYIDLRVIGRIVSWSKVRVVNFSVLDTFDDMRLYFDPESRRHRSLCDPFELSI